MVRMISPVTELPEDILFDILSWLPVILLLQIKSVCKSWYFAISNPKFIKLHLDRTIANEKPSIIFSSFRSSAVLVSSIHRRSPENALNLHLPPPFNGFHLVSSCNGVICLGTDDVISLWNPSTKGYKYLPVPLYNLQACQKAYPATKGFVSLGFGFDSLSNDYRVVRIINQGNSQVQVELYSANADLWEEIKVQKPILVQRKTCDAFVKDVLYWLSMDGLGLVSFDLRRKAFELISLPPRCEQQDRDIVEVMDFKGSVAMIMYSDVVGYRHSRISLWTMDDECGEISWTKKFTYSVVMDIRRVYDPDIYEFLRGGQFLATRLGGLFVYHDNKTEVLRHARLAPHEWDVGVYSYTESLVSFRGFNQLG